MTWPTTPIPTTNLDAGSDQPRLARADLKQMADAVNDIQATFDINGASDGDIIVYNNSTSTWEYTDGATYIAANATPSIAEALIKVDSGTVTGVSGRQTLPISEVYDPIGFISISSNQFTLSAGTYVIQSFGAVENAGSTGGAGTPEPMQLYNVTDSAISVDLKSTFIATDTGIWSKSYTLTLATSKTFSLTFVSSSGSDRFYYGANSSPTYLAEQQLLVRKLP